MPKRRAALVVGLAALLAGCAAAGVNYTDPAGPRYAAERPARALDPDTLTVVSFNVEWGKHVAEVIALLRSESRLSRADVIALQEMDESGTRAIADALGLSYVYYPATLHPVTGRDFGNAVLSRFPIAEDRKVILPHLARFRRTERAAVGATLRVGDRFVRFYSVHLATMLNNGPRARREQLAAVLADAEPYEAVVVAGDLNSATVPEIALARGYAWPSRHLGRTEAFGMLDHVLLRGVELAPAPAIGLVHEIHGASDHKPVWVRVVLPPERGPGGE